MSMKISRGFALIELMAVIALAAVVFGLTLTTFSSFADMQSVDKENDVIIAYIQKARNQTINAKNGNQFGVHFASSTVTIYEGSAYAAGAGSNLVYRLSPKVEISALALTGNANRVLFEQLTGKPNATGTVRIRLKTKAAHTKASVIYGSGLVEAIN